MDEPRTVTLAQAIPVWFRVAMLSFGGPAGQIAVMHRILVEEKKWVSEDRFLHALSYCMLLPGPEAQQLATYVGWLLHRTPGGLIAGGLFILPGYIVMLLLSMVYASFQQTILISALFFGLKPAVMAIVCEAVMRIGRRVLKNPAMISVAVISFSLIFFLAVPFPILIVVSAITGMLGQRFAPTWFVLTSESRTSTQPSAKPSSTTVPCTTHQTVPDSAAPTIRRALIVSVVCLSLWFGPFLPIWYFTGTDSVYWQEGLFFSKTAVVTFGGAYAVLAYIAQQAVDNYGWLQPGEMMDGLGMAETTPGPLIMVVQFVGFLGAYRNAGTISPLTAGFLGATITTWVTFVPCFFWIFLGAPYVERLRGNQVLNAILSTITAAVVGVILNLAVWFSVHTLFHDVHTVEFGPLRVLIPAPTSLDPAALLIAIAAFVLTFRLHRGMGITLAICCLLGLTAKLLTSL